VRGFVKIAAILAAGAAFCLPTIYGCGGDDGDSAAAADPFFGVAPEGLQSESDYSRMRAGGIGTVRAVLQWSGIESSKGAYDWSASDELIGQIATADLQPLVTVFGTPAAYAPAATDAPTNDPRTLDAWAKFLKAAVDRYGAGGDFWAGFAESDPGTDPQPVREWEIWNEPNSSTFWAPKPNPGDYAELLTRSAKIIGARDPEARVMSAGMFATPQSDGAIVSYDFLADLFADDRVAAGVDAVGIHPYGPDTDSVLGQVEKTRKTLDDDGVDVPMWATEIGWGSDPSSGADLAKTPPEQADLLSESFGALRDSRDELGVDGVVWYTWHDATGNSVGSCGWCASAGLVDADRDSKPSWDAYTELTGGTP